MFNVRRIVVPTDFSDISLTAFEYARSLAEQYSAKIYIVYVMDKTPPFLALRTLDVTEEKVMESMQEKATESLEEILDRLRLSTDVEIEGTLRKGVDYEEITGYANEIGADLIVIATHGRTGVIHSLMGSVAEKVIRYSKIPVLVTTPANAE
ncbi:MAG: universal stress protein [Bacteroidota bacterium]